MRSLLLTILALLFIKIAHAQQSGNAAALPADKKTDSLLVALKKAKTDTGRINSLYELGILSHRNLQNNELLKYGTEAMALSKKIDYKRGIGISHYLTGLYYYAQSNYSQSRKDVLTASKILEETSDKKVLGLCMSLIGAIYLAEEDNYYETIQYQNRALEIWKELDLKVEKARVFILLGKALGELGNLAESLEYQYKALTIMEQLGDKKGMSACYKGIGNVFNKQGNDSLFLKNLLVSLKLDQETGNRFAAAQSTNAIGVVYSKQGKYEEAIQVYLNSLKIFEEPGAPSFGVQWCHTLIAIVYQHRGDSALSAGNTEAANSMFGKALDHYQIALKKSEAIKSPVFIAEKKYFIGYIYIQLKKISLARANILSALEFFKKSGDKQMIAGSYQRLSEIDSMAGNYKNAYENYKLGDAFEDSFYNSETMKKIEMNKTKYEVDKKEKEIQLLTAENKLKTIETEKESQKSKFAYAGIAAVLLLSGYGFYHYRRSKKMEMQQTQMKDRLNISRGLHDDMGSTLSSISVYSKVAQIKSDENNKQELNDVLEKISMASSEMVAEMNDTVWAINPGNDNMEKIIQRMESFARPLVAARNIHFSFQYDKEIHSIQLDMEKRKNFYLIFKEAVNNAIKYSGASALKVELTQSNSHFELLVKDDGVGFNVEQEMKESSPSLSGNGLRNMQMRAKEMKGELQFNSIPGEATEIRLNFPIP